MVLFRHELRQNRTSFLIWMFAIAFLLLLCVFLFPQMKEQMKDATKAFASMGTFTDAFGMDRLNMSTMMGFYALECGNIVGLGGALYASFLGAGMLGKEEKDGTAEFLLSHPISRKRIISEKLAALFALILVMNILIVCASALAIHMVGETIDWKEFLLLHGSYLLLQMELAAVCFGISAFVKKGSAGIGISLVFILYFLNLIANMVEKAEFLHYVSPFAYCEGAEIFANGQLDIKLVSIGMLAGLCAIVIAYIWYSRKDIQ